MSVLSDILVSDKHHSEAVSHSPKAYSNPYVTGVALGLVLLAAFVLVGRGLGASGAVSSAVATVVSSVAPEHAKANSFYSSYLGGGTFGLFKDWLVLEVLGVMVGGFLSGILAHRIKRTVEKGPRISVRNRLFFAFIGGGLMGFGAKLARGCTSGQALTGGALLNLGSWAFMMMVFAGAYATAYFVRRLWI
ncbi:MAG: YeeE/YedE family protein [Ignavibacteriales bacterium]|nr:YeeE/YedE family protein [Ignavibacteriales bacterium]MCF8435453.1 YeeE/YedE family protein [Ignavibacteriales bacterium]